MIIDKQCGQELELTFDFICVFVWVLVSLLSTEV